MASSNVFKPLNAFRPFMAYDHGLPFGLPRAILRDNHLEIVPNPLASLDDYDRLLAHPDRELRRIGAMDDYYLSKFAWSPADVLPSVRMARMALGELRKVLGVLTPRGVYRGSSTAVITSLAVLDAFSHEATTQGARPIVAMFPAPRDVRAFVDRGVNTCAQTIAGLRERQIECVDLLEDLGKAAKEHGHDRVFTGRHYSEYGNEIVAGRLIAALRTVATPDDVSDPASRRTRGGILRAAGHP
jgi:hypothetical protein